MNTVPSVVASLDPVAEAIEGFRRHFGREPEGVWSAPARVNLIGEHTDYNDGYSLPFAINRRTAVAVARRADTLVRAGSAISEALVETDLSTLDAATGWSAYPFGVAWVLAAGAEAQAQAGAQADADADAGVSAPRTATTGLELFVASNVPIGAGLSSSAAIECATALALNELWALGLDRRALARACQRAENEVVGAPTGILDQSASMLGEHGHAVFLDFQSGEAEVIPLELEEAGLAVLIIDTRVSHNHASGGYAARRASCERAAAALGVSKLRESSLAELDASASLMDDETFRRARHILTDNQRVLDTVALLRTAGPGAIGPLLDASHLSTRDDFEISSPELDAAVETAQAHGALGARMTGGGFGGAAIALTPIHRIPAITAAIVDTFQARGFAPPELFTVIADDGARREH